MIFLLLRLPNDDYIDSSFMDEMAADYKAILEVMAAQHDFVENVGRFDPKIVRMCGDGSRVEDGNYSSRSA